MMNLWKVFAASCGGVNTALIECESGENGVWAIIGTVLDVMLVAIGAAALIGIIISGIQYMTSSGNPAAMTKAKNRIVQVVIGVAALVLMWAFMQWIIPGGIF